MIGKASASAALCAVLASVAGAAEHETVIDWVIKPYEDIKVTVGDKVVFNYDAVAHNVLIHPTNDCTEDGAIEIGPLGEDTEASVTHVFTEAEDGTTVTFACDVGSHCEVGQIVHFLVGDVASSDAPPAPPAGPPCGFCPDGVGDAEQVVGEGRTCGDVEAFAANLKADNEMCPRVKQAQAVCCPGAAEGPPAGGPEPPAGGPEPPAPPAPEGPPPKPAGPDSTIDWVIKEYEKMGAHPGDKVTFAYDATQHNVLIHPTNDCTEDGAIDIGPLGDDTEASVTHVFTEDEVGTTVTFACDVGAHCEVGQIVHFVVTDKPPPPPDAPPPPVDDSAKEEEEEEENKETETETTPDDSAADDSAGVAAQGREVVIAAATMLAAAAII